MNISVAAKLKVLPLEQQSNVMQLLVVCSSSHSLLQVYPARLFIVEASRSSGALQSGPGRYLGLVCDPFSAVRDHLCLPPMFRTDLSLLFLYLFLLASLLQLSCARCTVRHAGFMHGISVPRSPCWWSLVFILDRVQQLGEQILTLVQ